MTSSALATWLALPSWGDDSAEPGPRSRHGWGTRSDGVADEVSEPASVAGDPIVHRIQQGDETAFAELVHSYGERLFRFAYRELASREVAEEVVQDVFANVWARRAVWTVRQTVVTYLFQAVRHRVQNARRAQQATYQLEQALMPDGPTSIFQASLAPDAALAERDLMAALERALGRLPERPRQVFHLHREQHLSFRDIATVLDVSIRTVEHHMARAVAQLRLELAEWLP